MKIEIKEKNGTKYLTGLPGEKLVRSEADINSLLSLCYEHATNRILFYPTNLTPNFFDLSSREAGEILQKFSTYRVKAALVVTPETAQSSKFGEMAQEANRGKVFRVFDKEEDAEKWLTRNDF
ncbi:DUF4180 domain-containing protein [bacterium]|nr:DUF4180 domain-containing protein [bacterium]